jgi:arsenate reductase (thioredoxin)
MESGEMTKHKPKALFLSTGNATRSLIAENFLRTLTADRVNVVSVAVEPSNLNPLAIEVTKEAGIDISNQKPKTIGQSLKESFGHVITISDTVKERNPISPPLPRRSELEDRRPKLRPRTARAENRNIPPNARQNRGQG